MKKSIFLIILVFSGLLLRAQGYKQAIGIRGGVTSGFEYRIYTNDTNSYKFLLGIRNEGLQAHVLKEFHKYDLFSFSEQLVFIYGAGLHAGFETWDEIHYQSNTRSYENRSSFLAGLDGLAAFEYTFYEAPISVGLEVKPFFDLFGKNTFRVQPFDFAFTVKYLF